MNRIRVVRQDRDRVGPGEAFTAAEVAHLFHIKGTQHYPNASHGIDAPVTRAYPELDPVVARNEEATDALLQPGMDADPVTVAQKITRASSPFPPSLDCYGVWSTSPTPETR
jgi:hypothetical protein